MKITIIHGQNHKGSTYHVGRILAEALEPEENITEFFLPRDLNHFCLGCYTCIDNEKNCPFYEEKKKIADAMEAADLLIFMTPNYCMAPSAPMKAFIDLFYQYWIPHRPRKLYVFQKGCRYLNNSGNRSRASSGKPSFFIRFMFRMMALSRRKAIGDVPAETSYWQENGWLDGRVPWKDK